ncbi:hypothetical protein PT197_05320 [Erysipelothrix rhusiopathiae]|nr:hypothetical protein [Erysipelothrix rhusiopathiae]MDE8281723.1 hypothetical protein [Erysipelothrix rhusiopathiae]MDE8322638.1 hypothetical protein [Erysipelothrix rhusiopathiae]
MTMKVNDITEEHGFTEEEKKLFHSMIQLGKFSIRDENMDLGRELKSLIEKHFNENK